MSEDWLDILRAAVVTFGSRKAAADKIGISRTAVSLTLDGKYPGDTAKVKAKVLEKLCGAVDCPYLNARILHDECAAMRTRRAPGTREKLEHWLACQECPVGDAKGLPRSRSAPAATVKDAPRAEVSHAQR